MIARTASVSEAKGRGRPFALYTPTTPEPSAAFGELAELLALLDSARVSSDLAGAQDKLERLSRRTPDFPPVRFYASRLPGEAPRSGDDGHAYWVLDAK